MEFICAWFGALHGLRRESPRQRDFTLFLIQTIITREIRIFLLQVSNKYILISIRTWNFTFWTKTTEIIGIIVNASPGQLFIIFAALLWFYMGLIILDLRLRFVHFYLTQHYIISHSIETLTLNLNIFVNFEE